MFPFTEEEVDDRTYQDEQWEQLQFPDWGPDETAQEDD